MKALFVASIVSISLSMLSACRRSVETEVEVRDVRVEIKEGHVYFIGDAARFEEVAVGKSIEDLFRLWRIEHTRGPGFWGEYNGRITLVAPASSGPRELTLNIRDGMIEADPKSTERKTSDFDD